MRSAPAASDNARLATSSDLPTFGSPPTNRMPCGGSRPGSTRHGGAPPAAAQQLTQRKHHSLAKQRCLHSSASLVASSRIASSTSGGLARRGEAQRGQSQFVDLAQNAFGGLIQSLPRGVVKQRLGNAGGLELMRQIGVEFLAREPFQVILHGDALAQRFVHLQRERAAQQRLADQQQRQVAGGIHIEVQQQREAVPARDGRASWASSQMRIGCCFLL